jgi:hypothetical protein
MSTCWNKHKKKKPLTPMNVTSVYLKNWIKEEKKHSYACI